MKNDHASGEDGATKVMFLISFKGRKSRIMYQYSNLLWDQIFYLLCVMTELQPELTWNVV